MLPYVLRQLAEVCHARPLTPKVLFVPSLGTGYDLVAALARHGTGWTNLRVTTPLLHADMGLQPRRVAAGGRRLDAEGRRSLAHSVLDAYPADARAFFRTAVAGAGLGASLGRTFEDLRLARVSPSQLAEGGARSPKLHDLAILYADYCQRLLSGSWWDDARVLATATQAAQEDAPPGIVWIAVDELELSPLARDYVLAVTGGRQQEVWRLGRRDGVAQMPPDSAAVQLRAWPLPAAVPSPPSTPHVDRQPTDPVPAAAAPRQPAGGVPGLAKGLVQGDLFLDPLREAVSAEDGPGQLFAITPRAAVAVDDTDVAPGGRLLGSGLRVEDGDQVRLWQTVGIETEVRAVLRDILELGLRLDEVEIAYTATIPYRGLLFDAVERWQLPANFAAGIPSDLTRPGRALAAFLRWVAGGLDGVELAGHLRSGDLSWEKDEVGPTPGGVATWLLAGHVGRGIAAAADALQRRFQAAPPRDEGQRHRQQAAVTRIQGLHDILPPEHGLLAESALAAVAFLEGLPLPGRDPVAERDGRIRDALLGCLRGVAEGPPVHGPREAHAGRLLDILGRHASEATRASPGHLRVAPLTAAAYSARPYLFIVGLDESRFAFGGDEDPLLLDDERRSLSHELRLLRPGVAQAQRQLLRVLGAAAGEVTLIASRLHLADGREPYPTPLFEQARRQLDVEPRWVWPLPAATDEAAADDLEAVLGGRSRSGYRDAVAAVFPDAARGARAQRARQAPEPSRFDGWIQLAGAEALSAADGERVLSSAMLETLAACPRRYLMRYGLGLRPLEDPRRDPRRWLQPLEMGSLLHEVFLQYMGELRDAGRRPDAGDLPRLEELVAAALAAAVARQPVQLQAAYRNDRRLVERAARIFLHAEAHRLTADPSLSPWALELDFGAEADVVVHLTEDLTFRVRGRIDRIDRVGDGDAFEIWDYKTGSTYAFDAADLLRGGRTLQWALYARVLPQLAAGATVRRSGYFFASDRGAGQRFAEAPPADERLAQVLQPLFDMAAAGFFPALHKGDRRGGDACRFCDYRRVCAAEARGETDVGEQLQASAQAAALVEGWAQSLSARRTTGKETTRRSLEAELERRGLRPEDVVPEATVQLQQDWIQA